MLDNLIAQGNLLKGAGAAFLGGLVSFFLPCVLPLVPAYLSFVSGVSIQDMKAMTAGDSLRRVVGRTLAFILGFGTVYTALGAAAGVVGQAIRNPWFFRIAGIVLILLGLHLAGLLKISALYRERRFHVASRPASLIGAFVVGVAFAFGWSPCIGPVLGGIFTLAAAQETVGLAIFLLAVYSLGLGVPFLISAIAINRFLWLFERVRQRLRMIEVIGAVILIALGVVLVLDPQKALLSRFLG